MYKFKTYISEKYHVQFGPETDRERSLWRWSVDNSAKFWGEVWGYTGVVASEEWEQVVDESTNIFPRPAWFSGAKLNFAENLLFPRVGSSSVSVDEDAIAVIAATEREEREYVSWKELRERVRACAAALKGKVKIGDRVAGEFNLP